MKFLIFYIFFIEIPKENKGEVFVNYKRGVIIIIILKNIMELFMIIFQMINDYNHKNKL